MQSNTPRSKNVTKLERTSTKKESENRRSRSSPRDAPALSLALENNEISIIGARNEALENLSGDSVFALSPVNDGTPPPPPLPTIVEEPVQQKFVQHGKKPGRFAFYSDGGIAVCRICHSSEASCPFSNGEPLISPCHCRGSTGLYHRTCLERWLSSSNKDKCEICKFQYFIEREQKGLCEFLTKPGSKPIRRHVISDLVCFLILTPTAIIGAWLCIAGAISRTGKAANPEPYDKVQIPTLIGLATFLVVTYFVWIVICFRYHLKVWRRWRLRNYRIRVLDAEEAKKKRRTASTANSNGRTRALRPATTPQENAIQPSSSRSQRSGASERTNYSTPWPQPQAIRNAQIYSSPFDYSPRNFPNPSAVSEPRPSAPFQEIPL